MDAPNNETRGDDDDDVYQESFERASADLLILRAAYPDEITFAGGEIVDGEQIAQPTMFPLIFTLRLGHGATITMEFPKGKKMYG